MSQNGWTHFQDTLLLQAFEKYADKWQFISTAFPGKTAMECASRYKTLSERGQTLSDYQPQKVQKVQKKPLSIVKAKAFADLPNSSSPLSTSCIKSEPIESFLDYFNAQNSKMHLQTSPLCNSTIEQYSDQLNCPDEEIEKRHEFSSIKIPRWEVDDLFQETVEMMADEEKGVLPSCTTVEPNWAMTKKQKFSTDQLNLLQSQLNSFFQLTVQTLAIIKETSGQSDSKTQGWKRELEELVDLSKWGNSVMGENSMFKISGLELIPKALNITCDNNLQDSIDFKYNLKIAVQPKVKSRFLESKESPSNSTKKRTKQLKTVALTDSIKKTLEIFTGIFDPKLLPEIIPVVESDIYDFSTLEIDLFFLGLQTFGFSDFASVRAFYLPTKTVTQIRRKFQNVKYRKASKGMEKIKALWLQPFKPLVVSERELIVEGYKKFGKRFRVTVRTLFGTYPTTLLKQVWDELYLLGEIDATWLNPRSLDTSTQNKSADFYKPTRRSPRKTLVPLALPPLMIRQPVDRTISSHSTPTHNDNILYSFNSSVRKEPRQNLYPTSVFHNHQNDTHSFLQEIFTDHGSIYNPTSEWDYALTNNEQADDINYADFLETIFEPDIADAEEKENYINKDQNNDQIENRPLISLAGAYVYDSSDEEDLNASFHQNASKNTVDQEIESFFKANIESGPFVSPDRRVTRASSRIVTANNSASKAKSSPKQLHLKNMSKRGPRKSLFSDFTAEKNSASRKRDFQESEPASKRLCTQSPFEAFFTTDVIDRKILNPCI